MWIILWQNCVNVTHFSIYTLVDMSALRGEFCISNSKIYPHQSMYACVNLNCCYSNRENIHNYCSHAYLFFGQITTYPHMV